MIMKRKKTWVDSILFSLAQRVASESDQGNKKSNGWNKLGRTNSMKLKACTKYKTVPDFFYIIKNHFILFSWATLLKPYKKNFAWGPYK